MNVYICINIYIYIYSKDTIYAIIAFNDNNNIKEQR